MTVLEIPEAVDAKVVAPIGSTSSASPNRPFGWFSWAAKQMHGCGEALCGGVAMVVGLATLATVPVLQLASLGFLLESSAAVSRTGKFRDGFPGLRTAARVGGAVAVIWLMLLVPRLIASLWADARLVDPLADRAQLLGLATFAATLWVVVHATAALWRGGRLWHFLWPRPIRFLLDVTSPGAMSSFVSKIRQSIPLYWFLGLMAQGIRGVLVAVVWLLLPTILLTMGADNPIIALLGIVLLAIVALYLPLLQVRAARLGRFREGFNIQAVWRDARRAPLAHLLATTATLVLAVPLYLLKIEMTPREMAWLPALLFVASIWPARLLAGWAAARAQVYPGGWWKFGLRSATLLLLLFPMALIYAATVFFSQYASWYGADSLLQQHAFLLPAPLLPK